MTGIVKYGKTASVFYGKTEVVIDGTKFELVYYILKTDIEVDGIRTDTYGILIVKSNMSGVEIERESEIDIWSDLLEVKVLTKRLFECKALPEELNYVVTDYVDEISCDVNAS